MRATKLFSLIEVLTQQQIKLISNYLKQEKGIVSFNLFQTLCSSKENNIDRDILFIKVFKKSRTKANDHLLRNEMSKLEDKIEYILAEDMALQELKSDKGLLNSYKIKAFKQLQLNDRIEEILSRQNTILQTGSDLNLLFNSYFQYADLLKTKSSSYQERAETMSLVFEECKVLFYQDTALKLAQLQLVESLHLFSQRQINKDARTIPLSVFDMPISLQEKDYTILSKYYIMLSNCLLHLDYDRENLQLFYDCADFVKEHQKGAVLLAEYAGILGMTATKLSIIGQFDEAELFFNRCLTLIPSHHNPNYNSLVVNFASNMIKQGKVKEALKLLNTVDNTLVLKNPNIKSHYNIRLIMCYLQLKDDVALNELLMKSDYGNLEPFEKIYYKISACNVYIIRKDYNRAYEEITNLLRSKLLNEIDDDYKPVAEFLKIVFHNLTVYSSVKKFPSKISAEIKSAIFEIENNSMPQMKHYTPFQWLIEELGLR